MSDSTDPVVRDKWVARVLGLNVARVTSPMATPADSARPTSPLSPSPQTGLMAQASAQGALGKPVGIVRAAGGVPAGSDLPVTASAITGLFPNMIELDLQLSRTTLPGVRTLFITTLNNDRAVATGMLEVK